MEKETNKSKIDVQTKIVCSGAMKGGVGKTSSTIIIATELALNYNKSIIVLDCDEQATISKTREQDQLIKPNWPAPYEIIKTKLAEIIPTIKELKSKKSYDYIFIDMPRITEDMDNEAISFDIVSLLAVLDYLLIPFYANTMELQSTTDFMEYVNTVKEWKDSKNYPFKFIGFQNKWKRQIENHEIPKWAEEIGLPLMKNVLKENNLISRHYSTYFSLRPKRGGKELISDFMDEVNLFLN